LSLQWEPQWEEVVVERSGIKLKVPRDKVTGLYACPICGFGEDASYFFTVDDLIRHILTHAKPGKAERVKVAVETFAIEGEAARVEEGEEE
jgi:hypothetical protein